MSESFPDQTFQVLPAVATDESTEAIQYENLSRYQKFKALMRAGREDYRTATLPQKAGMLVTAGLIAYEWGPGNESIIPLVGGEAISHTTDIKGAVLSGLVTGGAVGIQQMLSGAATSYSANAFPRLGEMAYEMINDDENEENIVSFNELPKSEKILNSFFLGASFNAVREATAVGNRNIIHNSRIAAKTAIINTFIVGSLVAGADIATQVADDTSFEQTVDTAVDIIKNPIIVTAAMISYYGIKKILRERNRRKAFIEKNTLNIEN